MNTFFQSMKARDEVRIFEKTKFDFEGEFTSHKKMVSSVGTEFFIVDGCRFHLRGGFEQGENPVHYAVPEKDADEHLARKKDYQAQWLANQHEAITWCNQQGIVFLTPATAKQYAQLIHSRLSQE